jgi:hypothetical protein
MEDTGGSGTVEGEVRLGTIVGTSGGTVDSSTIWDTRPVSGACSPSLLRSCATSSLRAAIVALLGLRVGDTKCERARLAQNLEPQSHLGRVSFGKVRHTLRWILQFPQGRWPSHFV